MTQSLRIGLFAAAGSALRLKNDLKKSGTHTGTTTDTSGSKEILPVCDVRKQWHIAMQRLHPQQHDHASIVQPTVPVGDYLLDSYLHGNVNECVLVTRRDKTDLQQYYSASKVGQMQLKLKLIDQSPGTPWTLACGLQQYVDGTNLKKANGTRPLHFAMGFPDIITSPHDVFQHLFKRLEDSRADVVLGLFQISNPQKYDMVRFHPISPATDTTTETDSKPAADSTHQAGRVTGIDIKPQSSNLEWTWVCAVWKEHFSRYLVDFTKTITATETNELQPKETYVGDILIAAMASGFTIECLCFSNGRVLDIGTPDDLKLARSSAVSEIFK